MYAYIAFMKRTQIYLDEAVHKRLKLESRLRGTSISDVIRDSLEKRRVEGARPLIEKMSSVFGLVKNGPDPEEMIRQLRRDRSFL